MKKHWWKVLTVVLLVYTVVAGMLSEVPRLAILNETIRNLFFHVPMWFGMILILLVSVIYSIKYLRTPSIKNDVIAVESAKVGVLFGVLGIVTGMEWARFTWGEFWSGDPKQNGAAIGLLIYFAYLVLRSSFAEQQQRARISAVYNIFAFAALIPLLFILPRMTDSLHPGNGGNPGFNAYDLDSRLRAVFYPAVIGWTLLGVWMVQLKSRVELLKYRLYENF
ncbi:MAG: cytochrome c biogenesis protein [Hymenobacteraceae bacterium]|nr:cytochrome c biogenesis protein [Hymenobacteraceae bacterium]MDX5395827.1 cytochrome c biogenesis protein [Hymenobacteraceae bacterium]MDX5442999.1 cytochrome c biogenesis protein [Hymenobacteraceae bacterium]MDX5511882.1 cytochrome c biogenesis protein [Hymenobacteraceae bacterium]